MTAADTSVRRRNKLLLPLSAGALLIIAGAIVAYWWTHRPPVFGIAARTPWTASRVMGTPEPPPPFETKRLFPKIAFKNPLDIAFAPASSRVFILEQTGKAWSFANNDSTEKPDLLLDVSQVRGLDQIEACSGLDSAYGITFHPRYQKNHFVYVCYTLAFAKAPKDAPPNKFNQLGTRVSRFTVNDVDPPVADLKSEQIVIQWPSGGHNGGCIKFGPDGMLYISSGDQADPAPPDPSRAGQNVGDLRSKILRIDVDHSSEGKAYSIPADNPFVKMPEARGEVWCYGLRNPWRMNFDSAAGGLWIGDVGWELWESVVRGEPGGNYGWSIMEGPNPVHPQDKPGPTPIIPPLIALSHSEAASLTGGIVYHGKKLPALQDQYIFGDWETRRIWAAPCDGKKLSPHRQIAQTDIRVVAFGEDASQDIYVVDYEQGGIYTLAPSEAAGKPSAFPLKLSETGLFTSVERQAAAPGVLPFDVNAPQWNDGATAERFIAVPSADNVARTDDDKIVYPKNTVLARTFSLEMTAGDAATRRHIETQIMHFDGRQWHGYSYRWNDAQNDAELVPPEGAEKPFTVADPASTTGKRRQIWRFASRAQCMTCHTSWTGYTLAFNEPQLDRTARYQTESRGAIEDSQVRMFRHIGLLPAPKPPEQPKDGAPAPLAPPPVVLTNPYNESADLDQRARSYLAVNCSVCHRDGGGGSALIHLNKELTLYETKLLTQPMLGTFDIPDARIVCPGEPARSVLFYRVSKVGTGRMPHIGSSVVDTRGISLIRQWIEKLRDTSGAQPMNEAAASAAAQDDAAMEVLQSSAGIASGRTREAADKLLASPFGALKLLCGTEDGRIPAPIINELRTHAATALNQPVRDLFVRFGNGEAESTKLGTSFDMARFLAIKGDAERGRRVFFEQAGGLCSRCHIVGGQGTDFGPDLSHIATKYNRAELLDNILYPSKTIDPKYVTFTVQTKKGDIYNGFLLSPAGTDVVLKDAERKEIHIPASDVQRMVGQTVSAMPEGLLTELEPQQAADLLEYVAGQK